MTEEGKVKEQVKKLFKRFGVYYHMPVQNGMGSPTLDFVACPWGYYLTIETKAPGKKPTPRQEVTMNEVRASGGFVFVVSDDDSLAVVEAFLELMQPCQNKNSLSGSPEVAPTATTTRSKRRLPKSAASSTS